MALEGGNEDEMGAGGIRSKGKDVSGLQVLTYSPFSESYGRKNKSLLNLGSSELAQNKKERRGRQRHCGTWTLLALHLSLYTVRSG